MRWGTTCFRVSGVHYRNEQGLPDFLKLHQQEIKSSILIKKIVHMKKVLIVDDSLYMRTLINTAFAASGRYDIVGQAATGHDAVEKALDLQPDLITLDNILPDMIGVDIIRILRQESVTSKIIMISAVGQEVVIEECLRAGSEDYLVKPFTDKDLLERADRLFPN
jgi:two-component system, chemotaxis family, chemotaxis protein CheY